MNSSMLRNLVLWGVIAAILLSVMQSFHSPVSQEELTYSEFVTEVQAGLVRRVVLQGQEIEGERIDNTRFVAVRPDAQDSGLMADLLNHDVVVEGRRDKGQNLWVQLLVAAFPILLIIAAFAFMSRQLQSRMGGRDGPLSFGRNRARLRTADEGDVTFADVAGVEEAKEDVQELVEFLRDPEKFKQLGGRIPRGVLMVGAPGTGKTLLAKAIAGEAKVPFFSVSGSDFVEMFVGVGASRVRDMFEQARKRSPCIVFIDEIDAVGRHRGAGLGGGNDEREQTLNQLLVEMDGFEAQDGIIIIAATNRPDVLDPALLRPGRFDRQVVVNLPDIRGRREILQVHVRKLPMAEDVDIHAIARGTPGFSGADLANLANEAALLAARNGLKKVQMAQFEQAKDKLMMGSERRSMVMSEEEKRNTAYHEAGHAIVGRLMPEHDPVYKVSIIPHGRALGVTMFLPEEDRYSHNRRGIISRVCSLFGGRVAEEIIHGPDGVTTGAANDIRQATELVRNMVTRWGLSKSMGPLLYDETEDEVFLGRIAATGSGRRISPDTARAIDEEVRRIIEECHETARNLLKENIKTLHAMAEALIQYETLSSEQIDDVMEGRSPRPPQDPAPPDPDPEPVVDDDESVAAGDDGPEEGETPLPVGNPAG